VLDPEIQALLDAINAAPQVAPEQVTVEEARAAHAEESERLGGPGEAVAEVRDLAIPGPAADIPARAYRPDTGAERPGAVAYFHGGGWCIGTLDSFDAACRALANAAGAVVVSVDYRLAPEHPFPAAVEDAEAAVRWLAEHADELGADPGRLAVAGDSAGGNLATITARRLRDAGGPPLRCQALIYPALDAGRDTLSYRENAEGYGLTAASMRRWWQLYLNGADGLQPDASPLRAGDLAGMPPAFVLTVDKDPLRDEGEAYARALEAAGVPATLEAYEDMPHGFLRWGGLVDRAHELIAALGAAARRALA
jgi:acetyl esterase